MSAAPLAVVVPCFNEAARLPLLLADLAAAPAGLLAELVVVANRYGFAFTPADMIRHQAATILSFTDEELSLYTQSGPWWMLCLEAYARYGK